MNRKMHLFILGFYLLGLNIGAGLILPLSTATATAQEATFKSFHDTVGEAYAPIRAAAGYLRTGNFMPASIELDTAYETWETHVMRFASAPPPFFANDRDFGRDLQFLQDRLRAALDSAVSGESKPAADHLAQFRRTLSDLRQRNGIHVFADCVLDLSESMDAIWTYRKSPPDFSDRTTLVELSKRTGVLESTIRRCDRLASDSDRTRNNYKRLIGAMIDSMKPLSESIRDANQTRFINVLREQRSLERLIAMEFG